MKKRMAFVCTLLALLFAASAAYAHTCSFGSWRVKRKPTCTGTGLKFKYCVSCDHWEQAEIPRLPHEVAEWTITKEPTCVKKGGKEGYCSSCKSVVKFTMNMIEHNYGEMVVTKEPGCNTHGKGESICSGCGRKRITEIRQLGHDWETSRVIKEPTCAKAGNGEQVCKRCGRTRTGKLDMLEHDWDEWVITQEPRGLNKGAKERACLACGTKDKERFYYEGTLYQDMKRCDEIIKLQQMLKDLGYYDGPINTGTFGKQTGRAVSRFQRDNGLEATEVADPKTIELIKAQWQKKTGKADTEQLAPEEMENALEAQPALEG